MGDFLGFDTSNYTTSAALYANGTIEQRKQLLPVREGQLGLRQSDAVFHHVQQLPGVAGDLLRRGKQITAIGVSVRPRDQEGSYMPCFSVGHSFAQCLAKALHVPLYRFSHQAGHIAAALYSSGQLHLLREPFLAYHVSGGTTEAVLVTPEEEHLFTCKIVSHSLDLKGGQAVDRVGQLLGLAFPAGNALEALALQHTEPIRCKPTMKGNDFCLSGLENKCQDLLHQKAPAPLVARFCLESISAALEESCARLLEQYGNLPVLFAGGVMSNTILRENLTKRFGAYFAEPAFSADNAAGVAILAAIRHGELLC